MVTQVRNEFVFQMAAAHAAGWERRPAAVLLPAQESPAKGTWKTTDINIYSETIKIFATFLYGI